MSQPAQSGAPVAAVTGAGGGIGAAVATRLSRDGYAVACLDVDEVSLHQTAARVGGKPYLCDVRSTETVETVARTIAEELGPVEVLVNVAGIFFTHNLVELSDAEWDSIVDVNLKGTFRMCRALLPGMVLRHRGAVVNIGSTAGLHGGRDRAAYCASKGGVVLLTRAMALDYGRHGVRVNCVCPGLVDTHMVSWLTQDRMALAAWQSSVPAQRLGTPEDVASAVAFLVGDDAGFLHGVSLVVDGGEGA